MLHRKLTFLHYISLINSEMQKNMTEVESAFHLQRGTIFLEKGSQCLFVNIGMIKKKILMFGNKLPID